MAKITPRESKTTIKVHTQKTKKLSAPRSWWNADDSKDMGQQLVSTAYFLREQNLYQWRKDAIYGKLYSNLPLLGWVGSNTSKLSTSRQMPIDRPTMPVVTSCIDTLVSRITQSEPRPIMLTDAGNYKNRSLSKQANRFILGEFYNSKAYPLGSKVLRDACIFGTGVAKVLKDENNRVSIERRLKSCILSDFNDAFDNNPRQIYELKLMDRQMLMELWPKHAGMIATAQAGYPQEWGGSNQTLADQLIVVEGWRLPSSKDAKDGVHAIGISEGLFDDEPWEKDHFPFAFMHYSEPLTGIWGSGVSELLMGTQIEINRLLMTMSRSINLMGVPRVFIEDSSKFVKAHFNNDIGMIGTYRGTAPLIVPGTSGLTGDIYQQLERLVNYAYQQCGISQLAAQAQKPAGLNSGEAIRNYDDLQTDRFATVSKHYKQFFIDLAYLALEEASEIAKDTGSYSTIYPSKQGTEKIDLPEMDSIKDTFVIQCYDVSSLPTDPAGRLQRITEMMQSGMISLKEGRRLLDYPDIEQDEKLANAEEERVLKMLDAIVEDGEYSPPDSFITNPMRALELQTQYYNMYEPCGLEDERKADLIRWGEQVKDLIQAAQPPALPPSPPGASPGNPPVAVPQGRPVSDVLPVAPGQ